MKAISLILLLSFSTLAFGEFNTSAYVKGSIAEVISSIDPKMLESDDFFEGAIVKKNVVVRFTGKHRKTSTVTRNYFKKWATTFSQDPSFAKRFAYEVEVKENGIKYWLPIQNTLTNAFAYEVKPNFNVRLYVMLLGGVKYHPILTINGFTMKGVPVI